MGRIKFQQEIIYHYDYVAKGHTFCYFKKIREEGIKY